MSILYPLFRVKFLSFFIFFILISSLAISNAHASSTTMSMPSALEVMTVTPSVTPVINIDPARAIPLGLGNTATGGSMLSISVGISNLSEPADLYIGLQSSVLLGGEFLLFAPDNTLHVYSSADLITWRSNTTGSIFQESILPDIPVELLPEGTYNFYFLMVPAGGSFDACRLWATSLNIVNNDQTPLSPTDQIDRCVDLTGQWSLLMHLKCGDNPEYDQMTVTDSGPITQDGCQITFTGAEGDTFHGSISGNDVQFTANYSVSGISVEADGYLTLQDDGELRGEASVNYQIPGCTSSSYAIVQGFPE